MESPSREFRARLIARCVGIVSGGPNAYVSFESEAEDGESYEMWAERKGSEMARRIWERVNK